MLNENEQLEAAIALAIEAHGGQRDKSGASYVEHLLAVMSSVESSTARQVAVLHDILEDTKTLRVDLENAGLPRRVIDAVELLTRREGVEYADYIVRLKPDTLAREVKIADIRDNYRIDRVAFREGHSQEDIRRIMNYILSFQFLSDQMDEPTYRRRMKALN